MKLKPRTLWKGLAIAMVAALLCGIVYERIGAGKTESGFPRSDVPSILADGP